MTLSIRNPKVGALAKRLAEMEKTTVTAAVAVALREAISRRTKRENASEAAKRIVEELGLKVAQPGSTTPSSVYHDLDEDLARPD